MCPKKRHEDEPMEVGYLPKAVLFSAELGGSFRVSVTANGFPLLALLDSGCRQSVIKSSYVSPKQYITKGVVNIKCVHGDIRPYPIADIVIVSSAGTSPEVRVGVMDSLPEDLIIGTDNPGFLNMFKDKLAKHGQDREIEVDQVVQPKVHSLSFVKLTQNASPPKKGSAKAAGYDLCSAYDYMIPSKEKAVIKTDLQIAVPTGSYGRIAPRSGLAAKYFIDVGAGVIDEDFRGNVAVLLFNFGPDSFKVTRGDRIAQLICERIACTELKEVERLDDTDRGSRGFGSTGVHTGTVHAVLPHDPWVMDKSFKFAQISDPTLMNAWEQAHQREVGSKKFPGFIIKDDLLYRIGCEGDPAQLLVPVAFRDQVLFFAHSHLVAGHSGAEKTTQNILRQFFWPGIYRDAESFCRQCDICQRMNMVRPPAVPLQPLPVIGKPFERVGMDLIGPLPRTKKGFQHILVVVDYATRFPEAFPLSVANSKQVGDKMIELFSRVGFPKEILTDQGTPFVSKLMREICSTLHIHQIRTSVYHPQTDGLVERYNRTIKSTLRKMMEVSGSDWDKMLPLALYAIRIQKQSSLGVSAFELLYGRQPRSLLEMTRDAWVNEQNEEVTATLDYATALKSNLGKVRELAMGHLLVSQTSQKRAYDRGKKWRQLQVGDWALVLLPSSSHKFKAEWMGPYKVVEVIGRTSYRLQVAPSKLQSYHINLLKKWLGPPPAEIHVADGAGSDSSTIDLLVHNEELQDRQQSELRMTLCTFQDVFSSRPGRTSMAEHCIDTPPGKKVRIKPYRVPEARRAAIKQEVEEMLRLGVIQPSKSDWSSPIVMVPKPDGSRRFCMDFRALNEISLFDAYPIPRVDELIEKLGNAKYISTLDLTKGYWQVPLRQEDIKKTAFSTEEGHFEFTVLPFGLHGAPATFQRLMNKVLAGLTDFTSAYLDDIVIYSPDWQSHLRHLSTVLNTLRKAGLTVNAKKFKLAFRKVKYLGYVLGHGLIEPQIEKVRVIADTPFPATRRDEIFFRASGLL
ncbi:uncharacterized protein LOC144762951 [Lissotriton helveticus]